MKRYLLPETGKYYKANMHSHSTLSDGQFTPEELKAWYKEHGYSVYAYTEHTHLHDVRYLDDEEFITIPSYEIGFMEPEKPAFDLYEGPAWHKAHREAIHMNLFAIDPNAKELDLSDLKGQFSVEVFNEAIRRAKAAGFFVSYNHPYWSHNEGDVYNNLEGVDAIEVLNGASWRSSGMDYTPHVYREMAWHGKRLVCVAGDDNHRPHHLGLAWTMINANELSHKAIMDSLQAGNCYISAGPEIKELYVEDGYVHIKTSPAQAIHFSTAGRRKLNVQIASDDDTPVTEASFKLDPVDVFFRISVKDMRGRPADTRIYYLDEGEWGFPEAEA